jgi:prepilin-type N-terminal cleavage/methylation domain-containing protein
MNMILKLQLKKNKKKGFTLIEVIVVLVILAILAAVAIPALMGYIDEANQKAILSEGRTVLVGIQALVSTAYGDGDTSPFSTSTTSVADKYFYNATAGTSVGGITPYSGMKLTDSGLKKLNSLTGATYAAADVKDIKAEGTGISGFQFTSGGKTLTYDKSATKKWTVA